MKFTKILWSIGLIGFLSLVAPNVANATIIHTVNESIPSGAASIGPDGGASCQQLTAVSTPVRAGSNSFKSNVLKCGERAELELDQSQAGRDLNTDYWYGWSIYIPADYEAGGSLVQFPTSPTDKNFLPPSRGGDGCGYVGSYLNTDRSTDTANFTLQYAGDADGIACQTFNVGDLTQWRGKWVDFIMDVKWTGNSNGYMSMYVRAGQNVDYTQVINYNGPTYWNDEGRAPYTKLGIYLGNPNWGGNAQVKTVYIDEYRQGVNSNFNEVAPYAGSQPPVDPPVDPPSSTPIYETFSPGDPPLNNFTQVLGGTFGVANGTLNITNPASNLTSNSNLAVHNTSLSGDFEYTVDAIVAADSVNTFQDYSVIFNYQDANNYYFVNFNENATTGTDVYRVANGVVTKEAEFTYTIDDGVSAYIKIKRVGNTVTIYADNVLVGSYTGFNSTTGKIGVGSRNDAASFDQVTVTQ